MRKRHAATFFAIVTVSVLMIGASAASAASPDDTGLVNPANGEWHMMASDEIVTSFFFGNSGDYPFVGDWDCNGTATPGLYRQADGYVYLRNTNTQGIADTKFYFGNPGDIPVAGDFNGDGCDTVSISRPANQTFYIINKLGSNDGGLGAADFSYVFGNPGDKPFVGDFDGDGVETVGLHRESTGLVYFRNSHTQGNADNQFIFGDPGDRLVAGDWTGNVVFSPALFRPSNTTMYYRYTNTQGNADEQTTWGDPGWLPVAGTFGSLALPASVETVESFLGNWDASWQTGNGPWQYSRIHPTALNALGAAKCEAFWGPWFTGDPTFANVLVSKSKPSMWRTDVYGALMNIPNTYTITTDETFEGITERFTWHIAAVGNKLYFFPDVCDA
jgi:hypothetical protein